MSFFLLGSLFLFFYTIIRLLAGFSIRPVLKILIALLILIFSLFHLGTYLFFGTLASPEMPYPILIVWGGGFIFILLLFTFLVVRDIFCIIGKLVYKKRAAKSNAFSAERRAFIASGVGAGLSIYGVKATTDLPEVITTEIHLERLPKELDGLMLAYITDLHASAMLQANKVEAIVEAVNALQPDIIVCTGDMIDGSPINRAKDVAPLAKLSAKYGIIGCVGNHEYYSGYERWMRVFDSLGLPLLHNDHKIFTINGKQLAFAGLEDPNAPRFKLPGPDIEKALKGIPDAVPVILMAHQPKLARENAQYPVDLQLSGHTHGGQIRGFDQIVASKNGGFLRGLYSLGAMQLYVSRGAGLWAGFPVRLGVPSEISRIILRSTK